jgi:hypothetical protein
VKGIRVTLPVSLADWPRVPPDGFPGIPQSVRPADWTVLFAGPALGVGGVRYCFPNLPPGVYWEMRSFLSEFVCLDGSPRG